MKSNRRNVFMVLAAAVLFLAAGVGQGFAQTATCGTTVWNLTAGQHTDVGSVTVSNDKDNLYVTYTLDYPGATFGELHMWAGNNLSNIPGGGQSRPAPGQLCGVMGGACFDATGLTTHTFTIPFSALNIVDATAGCGASLYVVTHAEVNIDTNNDGNPDQHETAFGGPIGGPGSAWWFYGSYTICCDLGNPPQCFNETAFAKGGYVWTTDKKSNPENLPSLKLTKNRWGWAINLTGTGSTTHDIWAGAGLNKTANGDRVGTLTVDWNGATATVTYQMDSGYLLQEVHLYAGDASPTVLAPGQYGYLDGFAPAGAPSYIFEVPLVDANATGGVWLIAHAVVSSDSPCE